MHRKLSNIFQRFCQIKPGKEFSKEITGYQWSRMKKIPALSFNHFPSPKGNEQAAVPQESDFANSGFSSFFSYWQKAPFRYI